MSILLNMAEISACLAAIVLLGLSSGKMKEFRGADSRVVENSISEKVFILVNGVKMGMIIKSKDTLMPVLLFVHGGPGMPEYFLTEDYPTGLEDYFTVVWWDQRGAGLSSSKTVDVSTMTAEQFIEDTINVTNYLRKRFKQDKIYLMAHSWGSFIGIQAVQRAPELYYAYIGMGQMTNQNESERLAYEYMKKYFKQMGDKKRAEELEQMSFQSEEYKKKRDDLMHRAGIGTMHHMKSVISGIFIKSLANTEYTLCEKINLWRGKIFSGRSHLSVEEYETDLREKVTKLEVPVYFFSGAYDYTVNFAMARDYLREIEAPVKGFYLFQQSAHSPVFEEPEKVIEIMKTDVLKGRNSLASVR